MFGSKIKIPDELYKRLDAAAKKLGASSLEEFAIKVLKKECDLVLNDKGKADLSASEVDDITKKMQGLGYID